MAFPVNATSAAIYAAWLAIVASGEPVKDFSDVLGTALGVPGTGDVEGPVSSVDGDIVLFDGVTGTLIKDSGITLTALALGLQAYADAGDASTLTSAEAYTDGLAATLTPLSRTLTAGAGLTGGGTLAADRTFNVATADGTIQVNADSIQVGTITNSNVADNTLTVAKLTAGTGGQILATVAGATAWATPGGDVTGAPSALTVGKINGTALATLSGATTGQALIWSGSAWAPSTDFGAQNLTTTGEIRVNTATPVLRLGLVAGSGAGSAASTGTIRLYDGASIVGRNAADSANTTLITWLTNNLTIGNNSFCKMNMTATTWSLQPNGLTTAASATTVQWAFGNGFLVGFAGAGTGDFGNGNNAAVGGAVVFHGQDSVWVTTNNTGGLGTFRGGDVSGGTVTNVGGDCIVRPGHGTGTGASDGTLRLRDGTSTDQATVNSTGFNVTSVLTIGTTPSATGTLRVASGFTQKGRLNANTGDRNLLSWSGANDILTLGDSSADPYIQLTRSTAIGLLGLGGTVVLQWQSSNLQMNVATFNFAVATTIGGSVRGAAGGDGVAVTWRAGDSADNSTATVVGGASTLRGGDLTGVGGTTHTGGATTVRGGDAVGATNNVGGSLTMRAGSGATTNGVLDIQSGAGTSRFKIAADGKMGFFAATPVAQQADMLALTDSTTGTPATTLVDVTTAALADPVKVNDNFASCLTQVNKVRTALRNLGLMI